MNRGPRNTLVLTSTHEKTTTTQFLFYFVNTFHNKMKKKKSNSESTSPSPIVLSKNLTNGRRGPCNKHDTCSTLSIEGLGVVKGHLNTPHMAYKGLQVTEEMCSSKHNQIHSLSYLSSTWGRQLMFYVQVKSNAWRNTSTEHSWGKREVRRQL